MRLSDLTDPGNYGRSFYGKVDDNHFSLIKCQPFSNNVLNAGNKNVIFVMDITPGNFNDTLEGELLKNAFATLKNSGKNVYVVSASGTSSWNTVKDGVRYINLPNLWNADGTINNNFKILTVKSDSRSMYFDLESVF